jgi:3-oxoacyl-[acyl-carrier-protein] synthase-1
VNVPIVAIGARTPVGYRADSSAAAIRCELRRIVEHPFMMDGLGDAIRMGLDDGLDVDQLSAVRLVVMGRSALKEALSGLGDLRGARLDVLLALPEVRPGFTDANSGWVAREIGHALVPRPIELAARGHAGALDALREAAQRIETGRAELCAVVGVDSYVTPDTVAWLDTANRIARKGNRDGFTPGEAGACVVVANRWLGFPALAALRGAHSAVEKITIHGAEEVLGLGLTEAIGGATASLRLPDEAIECVYCDLNGERYRTEEWGFAILRTSRALRTVQYEMTSTCIGDVGAAHGALGCILAARAWARGYANGPRALVWGSSEAGLRSAVVLEKVGA